MGTILDQILAVKGREIAAAKATCPLGEFRERLSHAPPVRDFFMALARPCVHPTGVHLIAEVKKASPSKGVIRQDFDPVQIATTYEQHGAACLSVLTDEQFFQGSLDYLTAIRRHVEIPLLRKDFIIDSYQLVEARLAGADAALLIAEALDDCTLRKLHNECIDLGLTPLVELHDPENLARVLDCGAMLIGVNNRDLRTFEVDLDRSMHLRAEVPADRLFVAESGIDSPHNVKQLAKAGVNAMLVGESLIKQADIGSAVDRLLGNVASAVKEAAYRRRAPTTD